MNRPPKHPRTATITGGVILALYLGSYAVLTLLGRYSSALPVNGTTVYVCHWQPRFMMSVPVHLTTGRQATVRNVPGTVYAPLVALDQRYWHAPQELVPAHAEYVPHPASRSR